MGRDEVTVMQSVMIRSSTTKNNTEELCTETLWLNASICKNNWSGWDFNCFPVIPNLHSVISTYCNKSDAVLNLSLRTEMANSECCKIKPTSSRNSKHTVDLLKWFISLNKVNLDNINLEVLLLWCNRGSLTNWISCSLANFFHSDSAMQHRL